MALERQLQRWTEAGLLEPRQAQRILEFEHGRERPMLLYAVAGLGGLAIAVGIVSIVAANWDDIPGRVKIGIDLSLLGAGGVAIAHSSARWPTWLREAALLALYGLTLASIALVGQVYQLGGSARVALSVWSLLTAPLMLLGTTGFASVVWLLGLQTTIAVWMSWLSERPLTAEGWALTGTSLVPWLLLAVGDSAWLRRFRPNYASTFVAVAWAELVLCASIGVNAFYDNAQTEPWNSLWLGFAIGAGVLALFWYRHQAEPNVQLSTGLLGACLVATYLPARLSPGDWDLVAALLFMGLWLLVALAAHHTRRYWLMNLATAVIGGRILIVYFEVFGSLLDTGLGLVGGGVVTLLLVWSWWRARRSLQQVQSP
jgi:uncharacterized membrane protein